MKVTVHTLHAFAKSGSGGNPAGVVIGSDGLSEQQMLAVAKKVGFSETAFVQTSSNADYRVRFFTPVAEVDLCGHATIATFYLLANQGIVMPGEYTQETNAGVLRIEIMKDWTVLMDQNPPQYLEVLEKEQVAESLNISPKIIRDDSPVQVVSTGLKDIFIPIDSIDSLMHIQPDMEKVRALSRKHDVIGYHLFTYETKLGSTAHCRNFAPLYDIDEEAATGTSTGALSCYLFKYQKICGPMDNLTFEQGYSMERPSEILAKLETVGGEITRVRVGGVAANIEQMELNV